MMRVTFLRVSGLRSTRGFAKEVGSVRILLTAVEKYRRWEIDYSEASSAERESWTRAEIIAKIYRAYKEERPVYFQKEKYTGRSLSHLNQRLVSVLEMGRQIKISYDNPLALILDSVEIL